MEKRTYTVAMIGIAESERNVLRSIFRLTQYRLYSYTLAVPGQASDILMVDADDAKVMAEWRHQNEDTRSSIYRSSIPTILVAMEPPSDSTLYHIKRPFVASRVINTLDQVAQRDLQGQRKRIIGEDKTQKIIVENIKTTVDVVEERKVYTALVVDDSSPVRKQIEIELKLFGIKVDTAATGEQGIELIRNNDYSLVFLDVVLPGIDGYQICKIIKRDKARKKIPIIMLTSKSSPFDRVKGALAGCNTYLTKPVKQDTFQKTVKKYLSKIQP